MFYHPDSKVYGTPTRDGLRYEDVRFSNSDDPKAAEGETMRALRALLNFANPDGDWGELTRGLTPEGHWLWLCAAHRKEYER